DPVEQVLVGGAGDADGLRADGGAGGVEHLLGVGEAAGEAAGGAVAAVRAAEHHVLVDADVLEVDLGGLGGADAELGLLLAGDEARAAARDEEAAHAGAAGLRRGLRPHHVGRRRATVGDPLLAAADDPVVAVGPR